MLWWKLYIIEVFHPLNLMAREKENYSDLWHKRLGHLNCNSLMLLSQNNMVFELLMIEREKSVWMHLWQHHQQAFSYEGARRVKEVLELVQTDICDPMNTLSHCHNRYFILFSDNLTRMMWVYFIRKNYEVFDVIKRFKAIFEKQRLSRSDRRKEYVSNELIKFWKDGGVERQLRVGYTIQQNGVFERKKESIRKMEKYVLFHKGHYNKYKFLWQKISDKYKICHYILFVTIFFPCH